MIRQATLKDLDAISEVENICFPPTQACTKEQFEKRLTYYPNHFWLWEQEGKIIAFADGFCTNQEELTDEMYEEASLHNEKGAYQMIFGLNTLPNYRKKGYASKLIQTIIKQSKAEGRKGVILTCLEEKIPFYEHLGFENQGVSSSVHGDVCWYQMIRRL